MSDTQADVCDALALTFKDQAAVDAWLDRSHPMFGGRTPREEIQAGHFGCVLAAIEAINSGFAS